MNMGAQQQQTRKVRFGTMKIRIGSDHIIKGPDGIARQFKTLDKSRHPKAKMVCVCLKCNKQFDTEEDLLANHPDERILQKQEEAHPYGWWSNDPVNPDDKPSKDGKIDPTKVLGLLSDVD